MTSVLLLDLCGVQCGDKGDISDISLFVDDADTYDVLCREVTAERVREHFGNRIAGPVRRYECRNVLALKFVLEGALGGGATRSLRADRYGKTMGLALLAMRVDVPAAVAQRRRPHAPTG